MKRYIIFALLALVSLSAPARAFSEPYTDTVIVKFGDNSKMVIYVESREDLEQLRQYDMDELVERFDSLLYADNNDTEVIYDEDSTSMRRRTVIKTFGNGSVRIEYDVVLSDDDDDDDTYQESHHAHRSDNDDDDDDDHDHDRHAKRRNHRVDSDFILDLGLNNYLENGQTPDATGQPYGLRPLGSRYVALGYSWRVRMGGPKSPLYFEPGLSVSWYNFMFQDNVQIIKDPAARMVTFPVDTVRNLQKSKLTASYLNVPASVGLKFGRGFRIAAGGYIGYRLGSHSKIKYDRDNGRSEKDKEHTNFYLNSWRYGVAGEIGFRDLTLFANYDLNPLFNEGFGPDLQAISGGIRLSF
ncbi:Outer membrane protein beta-barrel domain-containing protein [Catalinimonas alkaloidigena]|uniref:Outer membrane protein beta-barrel domain-containing protein n=1 Tax=Catalinimonas alkaloidigena TaxID=1075417 RepID=A0A1G9KW17_9BACT|nr:outer membrane beta-barrel protein [Catalinimonas alkaloidigena]SDL53744.1 Outer membrane protein beta-barrel domain-containing protein [Catalinimonas alkaloidigena]